METTDHSEWGQLTKWRQQTTVNEVNWLNKWRQQTTVNEVNWLNEAQTHQNDGNWKIQNNDVTVNELLLCMTKMLLCMNKMQAE